MWASSAAVEPETPRRIEVIFGGRAGGGDCGSLAPSINFSTSGLAKLPDASWTDATSDAWPDAAAGECSDAATDAFGKNPR